MMGKTPSARDEVFYYAGASLQAVRYKDWKAHFVVQNHGWAGPRDELNAPLLFNLRRDPYEKAADESGMYTKWMGKKMWAFGPVKALIQQHVMTLKEFPPHGTAMSNQDRIEEQARSDDGLAQ